MRIPTKDLTDVTLVTHEDDDEDDKDDGKFCFPTSQVSSFLSCPVPSKALLLCKNDIRMSEGFVCAPTCAVAYICFQHTIYRSKNTEVVA